MERFEQLEDKIKQFDQLEDKIGKIHAYVSYAEKVKPATASSLEDSFEKLAHEYKIVAEDRDKIVAELETINSVITTANQSSNHNTLLKSLDNKVMECVIKAGSSENVNRIHQIFNVYSR